MRWFAVWRERIRALVFGAQQDAAMAEELDFHLEQEAELLRKTGLGPEEARRQAQLRFGAIERCKEEVRDARGIGRVEDIWKDLTFAVRGLWRRPGFSLGVALTLGLGIGATTTVYSVVDGVMFRPLPYRDPSALVAVGAVIPDTEWVDGATDLQNLGRMSGWHYRRFEERTRSFETLAHVQSRLLAVPVGEGFVATTAPAVSPELFETLGVSPVLGRTFLPEEYGATKLRPDGPPIEPAVLITHGAWQRRYGGDPAVVGQPLEGRGPIVVGVLPPSFHPLEAFEQRPPDFYLPQPWHDIESHSIGTMVRVVGRLKQGVSVDQARAEARRIAADLASEFPGDTVQPDGSRVGIGVNGLHSQTIGTTGRSLGLFLGAAGLLLLLATMNGATLLFSRSLDRTREFGVRMALGASRTRVVRLIVSEAALLAVAGGSCGVLLAYGGVGALLRYAPPSLSIPRLNDIAVDARVLAVAGAVSIGTGIAAGLLPALGLTRRGRWGRLHRTGRVFAEPTSRLRAVLVGGQMTLAIVLLSGAGLFLNSFVRLSSVDPGFEADGLITMREAYKDSALVSGRPQWQAWDLLLEELRALPGVDSVAGTTTLPFLTPFWTASVHVPGDTPEAVRQPIAGYAITPGFLETMGSRLLQGRDVERIDGPDAQPIALVNESFVRTQLSGRDPIDLVIRMSSGDEEIPTRIVGVVEDIIQMRAQDGFRPAIYVPYTQYNSMAGIHAVIRTTMAPELLVDDLRRVSAWFNPIRQPRIDTMRDRMASTRADPQFQTLLIGAFAVVAMLLAAVGLYGSVTHAVGLRRRDFAVRMALGADRVGVLRIVFGQGMRLSIAGLGLGIVVTLLSSRALSGFLYGVEPNDPATLIMVGGVLVLVSAAACLAPARRATAVDPVTVLRAE